MLESKVIYPSYASDILSSTPFHFGLDQLVEDVRLLWVNALKASEIKLCFLTSA